MLKLTLRPGEFIGIGEDIRVIFSGGSANNIHLLIDAPRELNIARSSAGGNQGRSPYYREREISEEAKREITKIIRRERRANHTGGVRDDRRWMTESERSAGDSAG